MKTFLLLLVVVFALAYGAAQVFDNQDVLQVITAAGGRSPAAVAPISEAPKSIEVAVSTLPSPSATAAPAPTATATATSPAKEPTRSAQLTTPTPAAPRTPEPTPGPATATATRPDPTAARPAPMQSGASTPLGRVVGSGCYASHREGESWPETVGGVNGAVTCSNDLYYFKPAFAPASGILANTIVTYYGNRAAGSMGILGEYPLPELERRLKEHARAFDALNGDAGVTLAFDYIYLVANDSAPPYSHYTPRMDLFDEALAFAEERGMLFFVDLQLGYRDIETEVTKVLPYLLKRNVHLAIDTEFYMLHRKGIPGDTLGSMDAADINKIADLMQRYIVQNGLPDKILKVYQFDQVMLTNKDKLKVDVPNVRVLINGDGVGFGGIEGKINDYGEYAEQPRNALGIKLFFKWDSRVLTPTELMALEPPPNEIVYQ